jgi:hypothetical protein
MRSGQREKKMATILIEEVLMGLDEVKVSLDNAVLVLEAITDDMAPQLQEVKDILEQTLLQPLQSHLSVCERLLKHLATME